MASLIDPNVPITGNPTTLSVRQNFATAKAEIEALQLSDIVTLTGDITGSGSGTVPTTLPIINSNVGTFQGLQINAKGQVTGATNQSYLTTNQAITISGDATGTGTTAIPITLSNTAVAPGSYTNTSLTVDQKGRITAASNGALGLTGVTAGNGLTGGGTTGNVTISLTTPVSVPNGGLGVSSLTANALLVGTGTSPVHPSMIASDDGVSFKISSNIIVGSASGGASGAMGPGTLNVAGGYYVNGVAIGGTAVAVSDVPPATPAQGNQWWDSVAGQLYVYINDGTSSQWVAATNVPLAPNVILPLTANAVLVGNGSNPVVASAITSDNGATLRVTTNQIIGNAVTSPPSHALVINNAASTPQPTTIIPQAWFVSEAANAPLLLDYYATAGQGSVVGRRSRGTAAAPTAVQVGDNLVSVLGEGRGATAYSGFAARVDFAATENWTDSAQGTQILLGTTTPGSTGAQTRFNLRQGVVIGNAAPDPGQGALVLNANAAAPQPTTVAPQAWIAGQDGAQALAVVDAYGALPSLLLRRAQGTAAVPAAVASGSNLGAINAAGFGVSTYATSAQLAFGTLETQSETARGMQITSATAAIGSTTVLTRTAVRQGILVFDGSGTAPSGGTNGDMGPGTVNVAGSYYINGANIGAGHLPGTQTNDNAAAGQVGEVISTLVTGAVALATGVVVTVGTISLTAGDWDVQGEVWLSLGTGTVTLVQGAVNIVAAAMPGTVALGTSQGQLHIPSGGSIGYVTLPIGLCRASLAVTTNYYLVMSQTGGAGASGTGKIWARRRR